MRPRRRGENDNYQEIAGTCAGILRHPITLTTTAMLQESKKSNRSGWLVGLLLLSALLLLGFLYLDVSVRDSYSGMWNSASTAEARKQGILLKEYTVMPRQLRFQNYTAAFTDCWVEEKTRTAHEFIFFRKVTKLGEPRFVLNYQGQRIAPDPDSAGAAMLVPGREGNGLDLAASEYAPHPNRLAYGQFANVAFPDSIGNDTLYFSIIRSWSDKRNFLIKAYPKK